MGKNITSAIVGTVTLSPGDDPVLVSGSGYVHGAPVGIYGGIGATWTIDNQGTIAAQGSVSSGQAAGIVLLHDGTITNETGAFISGYGAGINISGTAASTIINAGTIASTSAVYGGAAYLSTADGTVSNTGLISGAYHGVAFVSGTGTVSNLSTITGKNQSGIELFDGGVVTNGTAGSKVSAEIYGGQLGIKVLGAGGTISNFGTVTTPGVDSVYLGAGGSVTNGSKTATKAAIYGKHSGINIQSSAGTIANFGSIGGGGAGILLNAGGSITNATSGTITGALQGIHAYGPVSIDNSGLIAGNKYGVYTFGFGSSTLTNSGTITNTGGSSGLAVELHGGTNLLVVKPGAVFNGGVDALSSSNNTLELARGASVGTLVGLGSVITNFGSIVFDPSAHWFIAGSTDALSGTISGFALGDTIELSSLTASYSSFDTASGVLTLNVSGGGTATLDMAGSFAGEHFVVNDVAGGTDVSLACFAEGTRMATERGMVAVETLREGDRVRTLLDGKLRPIRWLGHRRVDCRRHPEPTQVWPICVKADAFGRGRPYRDLWLSPCHALLIDGVLIPVGHLVNGRTIVQQARDTITYWHVELPEHTVLSAEGVPAESYLDTGNRSAFANGGPVLDLHPDFSWGVWAAQGCAPLVLDGPRLAGAKRGLLTRAMMLGHVMTDDPDLRVLADGRELNVATNGRSLRVRLPAATRCVRLISRVWSPAHVRADSDDLRTLGVAIARVRLDGCDVGRDSGVFAAGWHARELEWRWTDGDASLAVDGARKLEFEVALTGSYWDDQAPARANAA